MGDQKDGIKLKAEDIVNTAPDTTVMPKIPVEKPIKIVNEFVIIKNISPNLREIDLGRDKEIRIEPGKEVRVSKSVIEHPQFLAFRSSFIVKGAK